MHICSSWCIYIITRRHSTKSKLTCLDRITTNATKVFLDFLKSSHSYQINFYLINNAKQLENKWRASTSGRLCFIISADALVVITGTAQEKSGEAEVPVKPKEQGSIERRFEWNIAYITPFCSPDRVVCHSQEEARESGLSGQAISCAFPSGWIDIRILQAITHHNCTAYWISSNFLKLTPSFLLPDFYK